MIKWFAELLYKLLGDHTIMLQRNNALDKLESMMSEQEYEAWLIEELNKE